MPNHFPRTAKRNAQPNEHGVYTCPPDLVTRWREGRNYIEAALLELEGGIWLHKIDYMLKDGGAGGPFWFSPKDGDLDTALEGVVRDVGKALEAAGENGLKGAALKRLRVWADGIGDLGNWQVPEDGDDLQPEGLISPRDFSVEAAGEVVEDAPPQKSTRGRRPLPPRDLPVLMPNPEVEAEIVRETDLAMRLEADVFRKARETANAVGYELPAGSLDADLIQRDIAANMRRSVESVLEIGKGLLVLKAVCPHGEFTRRLDVLQVDQRLAQRFMQAAVKFSNFATSRNLPSQISKASTSTLLATSPTLLSQIGTQSKLFELLILDDEEITELAETGATGELALDDVATMSVKELRAALRTARGEKTAAEAVSAKSANKAQELEHELAKARLSPAARISDAEKEAALEAGKRQADIDLARDATDAAIVAVDAAVKKLKAALAGYFELLPPETPEHRTFLNGTPARIGGASDRLDELTGLKWDEWVNTAHRENDEPQEWQRELDDPTRSLRSLPPKGASAVSGQPFNGGDDDESFDAR